MGKPRSCKGTTRAGNACQNAPLRDGDYCLAHDRKEKEARGFGGPQPGSGRPRLPRPHELMRERIEQDIERILAPYFDALDNAVMHASFEGEVIASDHPDVGARIAAAEKLLDRVYGKPRQALEHTGPDGGPIEHTAALASDPEAARLAHALLAKARDHADD